MLYNYLIKEYQYYDGLSKVEVEALQHVNCCEKILFAGNEVHKLELDSNALKLARGFGGGMNAESTCGVITGGVMVLSHIYYEHPDYKKIIEDYIETFIRYNGAIECDILKELYKSEDEGCKAIILKAAIVFDEIVSKYK